MSLMTLIPETHLDLLDRPIISILSTANTKNQPQSTAVCHWVEDGFIKVSVTADRQKTKNLEGNPFASLFILDPTNGFHSLEVRGSVDIVPDPEAIGLPIIAEKYGLDLDYLKSLPGDRVTLVFHPFRVVAL